MGALLVTAALTVLAVALFLVAAAIMQIQSGGEPVPSASASVGASPAPSAASPVPSGVERPSIGSGGGASWTAVATFPGATVFDVTAGGPGWVAVGSAGAVGCEICPGIETYTGMIWISTDGRTWDEVAVPQAEGGSLYEVASGPGGLVAVGTQAVGSIGQQQVLVSADGRAWTRLEGTPFDMPGTVVNDIAGGSIFVAAGSVPEPEQGGWPAIWTSANGRDWVEAYRSSEEGWIYQTVRSDSGWTAIGAVWRPVDGGVNEMLLPVVWDSADGRTWSQHDLPLPVTANAGVAQAIVNAGPGLVAVGWANYPPFEPPGPVNGYAAWLSADGGSWVPAPVTPDMLEDIGGGLLVYASDDRVFGIGSGCRCGPGVPGRWWTTPDGLAWTQHQETPPNLLSVIPFDGGLLGVGIEDGEGAVFLSR
ncbi:MAG: hypothetical protein ACRDFZ_02205 [Candidatus Limnocylindria bacterium]